MFCCKKSGARSPAPLIRDITTAWRAVAASELYVGVIKNVLGIVVPVKAGVAIARLFHTGIGGTRGARRRARHSRHCRPPGRSRRRPESREISGETMANNTNRDTYVRT